MARTAHIYVSGSDAASAAIKSLLLANGIRHVEVNVAADPRLREELLARAGDVYPIVEIDDVYIGAATPARVRTGFRLRFSDPFSRVPGSCC
jgi:hypothetical protein